MCIRDSCLAERYRSQIEEEIPEVDAVVGCASNKAIDSIVARLFNGEEHLESYGLKKDFPLGGKRVIGTPAHYAYLKIAEGCNNRCHYCAIPGIRGPLRSREMADCVAEARWLAGEGVKEPVSYTHLDVYKRQAPSICFALARILLAAAPTVPPCFRHWRRSSPLLPRGEPLAGLSLIHI